MSHISVPSSDVAVRAPQTQVAKAIADIRESVLNARFWLSLAWIDIVQRYRGSMLGPFWLTLSTGAFIAGLGPIYSQLFGADLRTYLPYLALGLLVWNFIAASVNESCRSFIDFGSVMKQIRMPLSTQLLHVVTRNVIVFLHCIPLYALIILVFQLPLSWSMLLALPGFALLCLNLVNVGLILAIICVRFRDFIQVTASVMQIAFFVTPIMWRPDQRPILGLISDLNPLASLIALVRNPLMNEPLTAVQLGWGLGGFVLTSALAFFLFVRYRQRIIYWV